jgi:hypothetical protein
MPFGTKFLQGVIMDHEVVVREKMTERYLLDELKPEVRDEFEEHYFVCPECARDIRAGFEFVEQSKVVMAEDQEPLSLAASAEAEIARPGWFAWFRLNFAVPALALLLAVVGYQNLVTYPTLKAALKQPRVLPWASVNLGTYGGDAQPIGVPQGAGFLLLVRIPPDGAYTQYIADLYNPKGGLEWSLAFPANSGQDEWPMQVPGASRESGRYKLAVRGITATGESKDLGSGSFELQIQK